MASNNDKNVLLSPHFTFTMKILWLTWKDREHPLAGGAEVVNEELAKRLVADGHEVTFVVGGFQGGAASAKRDGIDIEIGRASCRERV